MATTSSLNIKKESRNPCLPLKMKIMFHNLVNRIPIMKLVSLTTVLNNTFIFVLFIKSRIVFLV
jgi:hypothetical protein